MMGRWRLEGRSRHNRHMQRRVFWIGLLTSLIVARLCHWRVLWVEEGYPLAAAREMLAGKTLYRDIWFDKPPLSAAVYALFGAPDGLWLRLLGAGFCLLAAWAAARAARRFWGEREAYWAAGLMAFFLTFDTHSAVLALTPDLLIVPLQCAAIGLAAAGLPFWAGLCAGVAFGFNTKAILILAACLLWQWKRAPRLLAGFAVPVALVSFWLMSTGAWGGYIQQVWVWGAAYARESLYVQPWYEGARRTAAWGGFHFALVAGALVASWKKQDDWRWALWMMLSFVGVGLGLRFFPRYYFHLLPVFVLLAARGYALLPRRWAIGMAMLLLIPLVRYGPRYVSVARGEKWADLAMFESSQRTAAELKRQARPTDALLVWGYRPDLFVLSGLPAATRYLDSQPLTGVIADRHLIDLKMTYPELARRNREQLMREPPPAWIADGLGPYNPWLGPTRLMPALMRQYELVFETPGFRLYRLRG
jgi:hypothetical protein